MKKKSLLVIGGSLFLLLFLAGCGYPAHIDPPLYTYESDKIASQSAFLHAIDVGGNYFAVKDTHSMEPVLLGGDYVVIQPVSFSNLVVGNIVAYNAEWYNNQPVVHRIVGIDSEGLIMSGDNNPTSESRFRVTTKNYIGLAIARYRVKK